MLQFDDSCYVDAKQYHLASFPTCNSTLNTSLRKPIRMQDLIQLGDSNTYLLGIILDFGLVPDVSMYHFPPVILTGKGFTNDSLASKSLPTLASPRVI